MEVLVFKTNIKYKKQVNAIQQHIAEHPGIIRWNVDLKDVDKILRIETTEPCSEKIELLINKAGYTCVELTH
jgi:short-subunit dehydrogenase